MEACDVVVSTEVILKRRQYRHYCCLCSNYTGKMVNDQRIRLHRFPAKASLKRIWLRRIKLMYHNYTNGPNDRVCSSHFDGGRKRGDDAVPSVFPMKKFKTTSVCKYSCIRVNAVV